MLSINTAMALSCASQLKAFVGSTNAVVMDAETTGLDEHSEIIEISIISTDGELLFTSLVKPVNKIDKEATKVHGITNEDVANAPSWLEVKNEVFSVLSGKVIGIYNAQYDLRLLKQSTVIAMNSALISGDLTENEHNEMDEFSGKQLTEAIDNSICLMHLYAGVYGEIREGKDECDLNQYRWQKLTDASEQVGYRHNSKAHRATADCEITLAVCSLVAGLIRTDEMLMDAAFYPAVKKLNKNSILRTIKLSEKRRSEELRRSNEIGDTSNQEGSVSRSHNGKGSVKNILWLMGLLGVTIMALKWILAL